jgi:hypothetical protein
MEARKRATSSLVVHDAGALAAACNWDMISLEDMRGVPQLFKYLSSERSEFRHMQLRM